MPFIQDVIVDSMKTGLSSINAKVNFRQLASQDVRLMFHPTSPANQTNTARYHVPTEHTLNAERQSDATKTDELEMAVIHSPSAEKHEAEEQEGKVQVKQIHLHIPQDEHHSPAPRITETTDATDGEEGRVEGEGRAPGEQ